MSQENLDRFVEATDAFNRGDVEAWLEPFDTEAVSSLKSPQWREPPWGTMA